MGLPADELRKALDTLAAWRADPDAPSACPHCGETRLAIADRSARPHAEWYHLVCAACGLDETIHIPLGAPTMGSPD